MFLLQWWDDEWGGDGKCWLTWARNSSCPPRIGNWLGLGIGGSCCGLRPWWACGNRRSWLCRGACVGRFFPMSRTSLGHGGRAWSWCLLYGRWRPTGMVHLHHPHQWMLNCAWAAGGHRRTGLPWIFWHVVQWQNLASKGFSRFIWYLTLPQWQLPS